MPAPSEAAMAAALFDPALPAPGGPRFAVHRNNVVAGLIGALGEACPAVKKLVGEAFFTAAASLFVRAFPPKSPVMLLYGEGFPGWIGAFPPAAHVPYLEDVARLERAWLEAFHAAGPDETALIRALFEDATFSTLAEAAAAGGFSLAAALRIAFDRGLVADIKERQDGRSQEAPRRAHECA